MIEGLAAYLVQQPGNILGVAACLFALWLLCRLTVLKHTPKANVLWIPGVLWLLYAAWEWLVLSRTPEANIRVDLLLIWPLIALVTLWAFIRTARGWRRERRPRN